MLAIQAVSVIAAALSSVFWIIGAGIRIRPLSLFRLSGPDSIPAALQRQSMMNAIAAIFASIATAGQALELFFR